MKKLSLIFSVLILFCCQNDVKNTYGSAYNETLINTNDYSYYVNLDLKTFQELDEVKSNINIDEPNNHLLAAAIFHATNIQRKKFNKPIFKHSDKLFVVAQSHSNDMVSYNFYSHTSLVRGKKTMSDRFKREGLQTNRWLAENIHSLTRFQMKIIGQQLK